MLSRALRLYPEVGIPDRYNPDLLLSRIRDPDSLPPILMYPGSSAYNGRPRFRLSGNKSGERRSG